MPKKTTAETRTFKPASGFAPFGHPKSSRQIGKAILELVMNSLDAGCTRSISNSPGTPLRWWTMARGL